MSNIAIYRIDFSLPVPALYIDVYNNTEISVSTEINVFTDDISSLPQEVLIDFKNKLQEKINYYVLEINNGKINPAISKYFAITADKKKTVEKYIL